MIEYIDAQTLSLAVASTGDATGVFDQIMKWAKVEHTWELWWIGFGVLAQAAFFCRWIVQLYASERRGESHMPDAFWWMSLVGASMLLLYYIVRGEPVGVLGQSVGWIVYSRNLALIRRQKAEVASGQVESAPNGDAT